MVKYEVVNKIEISGQDVCMDSLDIEELKRIAYAIQDSIMNRSGFQKKSKTAKPPNGGPIGQAAPIGEKRNKRRQE